MKAAVLYQAGQPLKIDDIEVPSITDDELLIRVLVCGVCHTDLKVAEGGTPFTPPTVLGHEVAGIVERVGKNQEAFFKESQRVIAARRYRCGRCEYCQAGRENLCSNPPRPRSLKKKDGSAVNRWNIGGFSQYLAVPGYVVASIPEGLSMEESSLIGCRVTTAYNAVKHRAELKPGDSALVIGCGGVGLNTIQFLRCFGAYPIVAVDIIDAKLEAAKKFGATHTINAGREDPVEAARSITGGGADKSFEAIGDPRTSDQIIRATRPGGTAVIIGGLSVPLTITDGSFSRKEINVTGVASRRANDVEEVIRMVKDHRIDLTGLISKTYGFEQINEALGDLRNGRLLMGISLWE